jgi:hypothetical protein
VSDYDDQPHYPSNATQATQAQKKKYDTLEKVFEQLSTFLDRFTILYDATLSKRRPGLDQIVTKTLAHLFYVLALSTKFLRESRFRLFVSYKLSSHCTYHTT